MISNDLFEGHLGVVSLSILSECTTEIERSHRLDRPIANLRCRLEILNRIGVVRSRESHEPGVEKKLGLSAICGLRPCQCLLSTIEVALMEMSDREMQIDLRCFRIESSRRIEGLGS